MNNRTCLRGVGVIEIIAATAIAAIFFTAMYELLIFSLRTVDKGVRQVEATYLSQEGVEAVRFMKNETWATNIAPLVNGTTYYPVISGNEWTLSTTNPGPINGVYTRTAIFEAVNRDASDDISAVGTLDSDTRNLTVRVA